MEVLELRSTGFPGPSATEYLEWWGFVCTPLTKYLLNVNTYFSLNTAIPLINRTGWCIMLEFPLKRKGTLSVFPG